MDRRAAAVTAFEGRLGHVFVDRALLERALTHASASHGVGNRLDNERLEFLGDRVLGLVIAQELMDRDPEAREGQLSKRLHRLVSCESCARAARAVGLGEALRLPGGESRRGARDQDTILADACEAVIAALYLEAGLEETARVVTRLWAGLLDEAVDPALANPKSELQEWAAAQGRTPPAYRVLSRTGPAHQPRFVLEVSIEGAPPAMAEGGSLRAAQKAAALSLLLRERGGG
ncbi:MAG: ribonuclease III [Pseudomonadota bacterium]